MDKTLLYYTNKGELLKFKKYTINEKGEIKNKKTGKIRKSRKDKNGYNRNDLYFNDKTKIVMTHRAVLSTFDTDGYFKDAQANHIDENKDNNILDNLEWLSCKDNANHGTRNSKIAKKVLCYDLNDNFVKEYKSLQDTEKDGFEITQVSKCCKSKQKTHKNHKFYYKNC